MDNLHARLDIEVRQTLHHAMGLLTLLNDEPLSKPQAEYLARCRDSLDRMLKAADDFSELARPVAASPVPPFPISDVVERVANLVGALADRKGLRFDCRVDSSMSSGLKGDQAFFEGTLQRILEEAIGFAGNGAFRFNATVSQAGPAALTATVEVGVSKESEGAGNLVDFEGGNILELGGRAFGLQVLKKRLERLGGSLVSISDADHGTILRMTLPMSVAQTSSALKASADIGDQTGKGMRLMVAEDSDECFALFESYTRAQGYSIDRAVNGREAVEMVQSGRYEMAVMDVHMPELDGYSATRQIREWETEQGRARIPIVLLSADDVERQITMGSTVGCSGFIAKPASRAQVLTALRFYAPPPAQVSIPQALP